MRERIAFIIALLIGVAGVLAPLHHHADGRTHDDCPLCVLQALAALPAPTPALAVEHVCRLVRALAVAPAPRAPSLALPEARAPPLLPF